MSNLEQIQIIFFKKNFIKVSSDEVSNIVISYKEKIILSHKLISALRYFTSCKPPFLRL